MLFMVTEIKDMTGTVKMPRNEYTHISKKVSCFSTHTNINLTIIITHDTIGARL